MNGNWKTWVVMGGLAVTSLLVMPTSSEARHRRRCCYNAGCCAPVAVNTCTFQTAPQQQMTWRQPVPAPITQCCNAGFGPQGRATYYQPSQQAYGPNGVQGGQGTYDQDGRPLNQNRSAPPPPPAERNPDGSRNGTAPPPTPTPE